MTLSSGQLQSLGSSQVVALTTTQISSLDGRSQQVWLTTNAIASLSTSQLWAFDIEESPRHQRAISSAQLAAMPTQALSNITEWFQYFSTAQLRGFTTAGIASLNSIALGALQTSQLLGLSTNQIAALTTSQMSYLSTSALNSLSTSQLRSIETQDIAALTTAQIQSLSSRSLSQLTTNQIKAIETVDVASLTTSQITALLSSQLSVLTSSQITSFGLSTTQLMSLTSSALSGLTTSQIQTIGNLKKLTPIVLDLHDDGINTSSLQNGTTFDLANTGQAVKTGWVTNGDGLLVLDINRDGIINNGGELFGEGTVLANGQRAKDGYEAMKALDTNRDGILNKADKAFSRLQVWIDSGDGITQRGELHSLTELGISSISLTSQASTVMDNGNLIGLMGSFTTSDGKTHTMGDVWFQTDASGNKVFDLAEIVSANMASINRGTVHLAADQTSALAIGLPDVLSYGQMDVVGTHEVVIDGSHSSAVNLTHCNDWSSVGHVDSGGEQYSVFVDPTHHAKLLINDKISVIL